VIGVVDVVDVCRLRSSAAAVCRRRTNRNAAAPAIHVTCSIFFLFFQGTEPVDWNGRSSVETGKGEILCGGRMPNGRLRWDGIRMWYDLDFVLKARSLFLIDE
jgi:hypothetical protein